MNDDSNDAKDAYDLTCARAYVQHWTPRGQVCYVYKRNMSMNTLSKSYMCNMYMVQK